MVSPMSSYIYYSALVAVADGMGVSVTLVNLTITSYLIFRRNCASHHGGPGGPGGGGSRCT
ncbi:hypothetical protein IMZ48_28625 [Candidatus Bathyarchaeota archaeon]|nr:hypothetical protein [Candidatus Bathyarchaeota archaeon]